MSKENIGKIYSRKRFLLKPQFNGDSIDQRGNQPNINSLGFKSNDAKKKLRTKIIKLIIIAILITLIIQLVFYYFEPIF